MIKERLNRVLRPIRKWWWQHNEQTRRRLRRGGIGLTLGIWLVLLLALLYLSVREWLRDEADTVTLNWLALGIVALLMLLSLVLSRQKNLPWLLAWFGNLSTEFAGAFILSALLLVLVTIPAERKAENQLKQQLIREMGSRDNATALRAVRELRAYGWLYDGSLKEASLGGANLQWVSLREVNLQGAFLLYANLQGSTLRDANLQGADLRFANLQETNLYFTNLHGAELRFANLQGADLWQADLQGANLEKADLQEAVLEGVNLQGTILEGVNLQGANLVEANLQDANLENTQFNEETILPDDTNWRPDTDMTRFTDPDHPDFWRSNIPFLPAYQPPDESDGR